MSNNAYKKQTVIKLDGEVKKVNSAQLHKIWRTINNFENYEVNPMLGVRNKNTGKVLKGRSWIGYPKVTLIKDNKKHEVRIHRVVAETFLPKKDPSYNIVNHKNGIRNDFSIHNLEWMNQSMNMKDRWLNQGKRPKYKPEY